MTDLPNAVPGSPNGYVTCTPFCDQDQSYKEI